MGKLSAKRNQNGARQASQLRRLKGERRTLTARLAMVNSKITRLESPGIAERKPSMVEFDRWLDELAADLPNLPLLPEKLSRADIYDTHD